MIKTKYQGGSRTEVLRHQFWLEIPERRFHLLVRNESSDINPLEPLPIPLLHRHSSSKIYIILDCFNVEKMEGFYRW